jgi:hypothetical protein
MKIINRIINWIKQQIIGERIYMACDFGADKDCYIYYIVKKNGTIEVLDIKEKDTGTPIY